MLARRILLLLLLSFAPLALLAQTPTTFTYQGRLYNNGALVNGSYVLRVTPFNQPTGPTQLASPLTTPALNVVDGVFSTTLDFGAGVFNGGAVWLAIEVQAPASGFVLLSPRQPVTPTPYAMNADRVGGLDATQLGNHDFADFYALMPPDNAATVAAGSDVQFPRDGASSGAIVRTSASEFALTAIGTYQVTFNVATTESGQLMLTLNGVDLPETVVGRATGTNQLTGTFVVTTTAANSLLTVRNPNGNVPALTITPFAGGTHQVSAHLVITRLR